MKNHFRIYQLLSLIYKISMIKLIFKVGKQYFKYLRDNKKIVENYYYYFLFYVE